MLDDCGDPFLMSFLRTTSPVPCLMPLESRGSTTSAPFLYAVSYFVPPRARTIVAMCLGGVWALMLLARPAHAQCQLQILSASDPQALGSFGGSVALNQGRVVIYIRV